MDWVVSTPLELHIAEEDKVVLLASIGWKGFGSVLGAIWRFRIRSVNPPGMVTLIRAAD